MKFLQMACLLLCGMLPIGALAAPTCEAAFIGGSPAVFQQFKQQAYTNSALSTDGKVYSMAFVGTLLANHVQANCADRLKLLPAANRTDAGYAGYVMRMNGFLSPGQSVTPKSGISVAAFEAQARKGGFKLFLPRPGQPAPTRAAARVPKAATPNNASLAEFSKLLETQGGKIDGLNADFDQLQNRLDGIEAQLPGMDERLTALEAAPQLDATAVQKLIDATIAALPDVSGVTQVELDALQADLPAQLTGLQTAAQVQAAIEKALQNAPFVTEEVYGQAMSAMRTELEGAISSATEGLATKDDLNSKLSAAARPSWLPGWVPAYSRSDVWLVVGFACMALFMVAGWFFNWQSRRGMRQDTAGVAGGVAEVRKELTATTAATVVASEMANQALREAREVARSTLNLPGGWELVSDLPTQDGIRGLSTGDQITLRFQHPEKGDVTVTYTYGSQSLLVKGIWNPGFAVEGTGEPKPIAARANSMIKTVRTAIELGRGQFGVSPKNVKHIA